MSLSLRVSSHPAAPDQLHLLSLRHPALYFMGFLLFLRCTILPKLVFAWLSITSPDPPPPPNSPRMMISLFKQNHSGASVSPQPSTDKFSALGSQCFEVSTLSQTALDYHMWVWISFPSAVKDLIGEHYPSSYSLFTIECLSLKCSA